MSEDRRPRNLNVIVLTLEIHVCCHVCIITITPIICVNVVDNVAFLLTSPYNLCISEEICLNGIGLYKVMNEHVGPKTQMLLSVRRLCRTALRLTGSLGRER